MDILEATHAFAALSQPTRLSVFRLLLQQGEQGMAAGDIADAMAVRQNTMSSNLSILTQARLIRSERQGRSIRYFANTEGLKGLLGFVLEDCCGGRPEQCRPLIEELSCAC